MSSGARTQMGANAGTAERAVQRRFPGGAWRGVPRTNHGGPPAIPVAEEPPEKAAERGAERCGADDGLLEQVGARHTGEAALDELRARAAKVAASKVHSEPCHGPGPWDRVRRSWLLHNTGLSAPATARRRTGSAIAISLESYPNKKPPRPAMTTSV